METSKDKITAVMDLFVNKLDWESSVLMAFSLEKRLISWATVLEFLVLKGLVKKNCRSASFCVCPETTFLRRFVHHFDEASELLKLYPILNRFCFAHCIG